MDGAHAGEVRDLLAARHAGRGEDGAGLGGACGWQKLALADRAGDLVMLARVAGTIRPSRSIRRRGSMTVHDGMREERARADAAGPIAF